MLFFKMGIYITALFIQAIRIMGVPMIKSYFLVLTVIGLLGLLIIGGNILYISPFQPAYSSPAEEPSDDGGQQQDESVDDEPVEEPEPTDEPEPEPEPLVTEPADETIPESPTEKQQEQLTLDIIDANGLVVVNETTTNIGGGEVGGDGTTAKEVKCVKNSQGQTFCYEELKPDEVCLKPINAEDPPLCPPPKP